MNDLAEFVTMLTGSVVGIVIVVFLLFLAICTIVMPIAVVLIHGHMVRQTKLLQDLVLDASKLHQTKLLSEIRNALQSMEAVGVEVEQPQVEYTPPPVPQSIGPRRHGVRPS
jgi:hypothetical protein